MQPNERITHIDHFVDRMLGAPDAAVRELVERDGAPPTAAFRSSPTQCVVQENIAHGSRHEREEVPLHPAYDALVDKVMRAITDPKQMETYSTPDQIAEGVYEAATDGKDQLRYVTGPDAKATYAARLQLGDEAFVKSIKQQFFG